MLTLVITRLNIGKHYLGLNANEGKYDTTANEVTLLELLVGITLLREGML